MFGILEGARVSGGVGVAEKLGSKDEEPTSVLEIFSSPSPASTLAASSVAARSGGARAGVSSDNSLTLQKYEWPESGRGMDYWTSVSADEDQETLMSVISGGNGDSVVVAAETGNLVSAIYSEYVVGDSGSGFQLSDYVGGCGKSGGLTSVDYGSGDVNCLVSDFVMNVDCNLGSEQKQDFEMLNSGRDNLVPLPMAFDSDMPSAAMVQHMVSKTFEEKPQFFSNKQVMMMNQQLHQHSAKHDDEFLVSPSYGLIQDSTYADLPHAKRHNSGGGHLGHQIPQTQFSETGHQFVVKKYQQQQQELGFPGHRQHLFSSLHFPRVQQNPMFTMPKQEMLGPGEALDQSRQHFQFQQQSLLDQLFTTCELIESGNFNLAQGILARLNQQLSHLGKPLHRAVFYFKEALQTALVNNTNSSISPPHPRSSTTYDVICKLGAFKFFSDVSPLMQFANFTATQALLEALDDADRIHIVDFDIGFGLHWASLMQELSLRGRGAPSLKITAFASTSTVHPLERRMLRETLTSYANEVGISFDLEVVCIDQLNSNSVPSIQVSDKEGLAVNFPIWATSRKPNMLPLLICFIKKLSPRLVISLDRGCHRSDLSLSKHILHALQSYIYLLESLEVANMASDVLSKIERFILKPKIEDLVMGRLHAPEQTPPWKAIFTSAGFTPVMFSNTAETQAECLVKTTPLGGFHVEKQQASLVLSWHRRELVSASAWRISKAETGF